MSLRTKPCKCGGMHSSLNCYLNKRKPMKKTGKVFKMWQHTRKSWITQHPAPWTCYICGKPLELEELTLDHIKSRSRHPELRYDEDNLAPCCLACNENKGSRDLDELS